LLLLTGCWDRAELTKKGFVMGLALDEGEGGKYRLTVQIFKPAQAVGGGGTEKSYVNIASEDYSIAKAIRDMPTHLGRKLQWSHLRVILVSDKLVKDTRLGEILEFFYRDHEPRVTASIMIARGRAADFLQMKPLIESTISQQLLDGQHSSATSNGETVDVNLLKLGLQIKSEVGNSLIPYVVIDRQDHQTVMTIQGAAMMKKGKMIGLLDSGKVEGLQIMLNKFASGMIQIPCGGKLNKKSVEAVEVLAMRSSARTVTGTRSLKVRYKIEIETALSELSCTKMETMEDQKKFTDRVEQTMRQKLAATSDFLKKNKFDALGLGNKIYQKNPSLWKKWKNDWDQLFAQTEFDYDVEVKTNNSGTMIDKAVYQ
jgi:spore germination protein KC